MAIGAFKDLFLVNLILFPIRLGIVAIASLGGLQCLAWSAVVRCVIAECFSLYRLRSHIPFEIADVFRSIKLSVIVTLGTIFGPMSIIAMNGFDFKLKVGASIAVALAAAIGWLASIWLLNHPIKSEINNIVSMVASRRLLKKQSLAVP